MMKLTKLWLPVFIWAGLVYFMSSIEQLSTGWGVYDLILRKLAHISEYFVLVALLYRALKDTFSKLTPFYLFAISFTASFLYAVSDEIHQLYVFGRSCSSRDLAFDTLGIIIFFITLKFRKAKGADNVY
ncbi:MAG: VanZ family protein [Candidatus Omnitrophota bacterium]